MEEIDFDLLLLEKQLKHIGKTIREAIGDKGIEAIWKEVFVL